MFTILSSKPQICSFDKVVMQARIWAKMGAALAARFISSLTDRVKISVGIIATNCSVFLLWNFISVWVKLINAQVKRSRNVHEVNYRQAISCVTTRLKWTFKFLSGASNRILNIFIKAAEKNAIILFICPSKFCVSIVSIFSWDLAAYHKPATRCLPLQVWFVRCKLCRVYVPTPLSARRGTHERIVFNRESH